MIKYFRLNSAFKLENGFQFDSIQVAYHSFGIFGKDKPIIWVCHALTANSDVSDWWAGLFGKNKTLNPDKYFIVCANNLGSCYGSEFSNSANGGSEVPLISTRDIARSHILLMEYLGIESVFMLIGGSQGGQIALEIAYSLRRKINNMVLLATNARHSAWGIAFNEAQRLCIEASSEEGLKAARAIAMLSYRNYEMYGRTEKVEDYEKIKDFGAADYQRYQAEKLKKRFDANSYYILSRAMDSHNLGRGRGELEQVLNQIKINTLLIGISSDILFPVSELEYLAKHMPFALLSIIDSAYGHDGFLTETIKINKIISAFLNSEKEKL
jgi:homoserine O-acetyltransferase